MKLYKAIGFFIVLLFGFSFGVKSALADPQTQTLGFCWSPPEQDSPVDHYIIYKSVNDSDYIEAGTTTDTCSSIEGIPGYTYRVKVAAVDTMDIIGPSSEESPPYTVLRMDGVSLRDTNSNSERFSNERGLRVSLVYLGSPIEVRLAQDSLFSLNSTGWQDLAADVFYTLTPGDGWRKVYAQLKDFLGIISQVKSDSIFVDTASPHSEVSGLPDYVNEPSFQIPYTYSDSLPGSGVARLELFYKVGGDNWVSYGSESPDSSFSFHSDEEGIYLFEIVAEDSAGNIEEQTFCAEDSVTVDATAPALESLVLKDVSSGSNLFTNGDTLSLLLSYSGSPSEVRLAEDSLFSVDSTGWIDLGEDLTYILSPGDNGWRNVYAQLRDPAGNTSSILSQGIFLDKVTPQARASGLPDFINELTFQIPYTYSDPPPASGVAWVELYYKKGDGNWQLYDSFSPGERISFNATGDTLYLFEIIAQDSAGNWEKRDSVAEDSVFVDSDVPLCLLSLKDQSSGVGLYTNKDTIVAALSYAGSPDWVRLAEDSSFTMNSTGWISLRDSLQFVLSDSLGDGWRWVFAQVKDDAGNLSPVASDSIFLDRVKPTSWVTEVPDSSNASFFAVHYEVSDSTPSSGIYRIELFYKIKGRDWTLYGEVGVESTFIFAPDSGDGYYWFQTIAQDSAGNVEPLTDAAEGSTLVDRKGPQVSILSPAAGDSLSCGAQTQILWSATDENNILTLHIFYKIGEEASWDSIAVVEGSDSSYQWQVPNVVSDSCRLKIVAYDFLGNSGVGETQGFFRLVDRTPPQVEVIVPNGGEKWRVGEEDTVRFRADDNIGVDSLSIFLSYDGGRSYPDTIVQSMSDDSLFIWQITDSLTSDSCLVKVVAYDGGGNVGMDESDSLFSILPPEGVDNRGLSSDLPQEFGLSQNYPNPFNGTTAISYQLSGVSPRSSAVGGSRARATSTIHVSLKVYNVLGELVRTLVDEEQGPGYYRVLWGGKDNLGREISSGVYFYRLRAGGFSVVRKVLMLR